MLACVSAHGFICVQADVESRTASVSWFIQQCGAVVGGIKDAQQELRAVTESGLIASFQVDTRSL